MASERAVGDIGAEGTVGVVEDEGARERLRRNAKTRAERKKTTATNSRKPPMLPRSTGKSQRESNELITAS
ncbi:MAG: hypothetical protein JO215_16510 [Ktedonobacteraceae bacterium]|nr:hypothetical protein [Ktedonobacteraceae bacterium]